MSETLMGPKCL